MQAIIGVKELSALLKKMKPKTTRFKSMRDPTVTITAGGSTIILMGEFDNSASAPAEIIEPGSGVIPLVPALRVLSTYVKSTKIELKVEPGAFWIDKMKISVSS